MDRRFQEKDREILWLKMKDAVNRMMENRDRNLALKDKARAELARNHALRQGARDPAGHKYSAVFTGSQSAIAAGPRGASSGGLRPLGPEYLLNRHLQGDGLIKKEIAKGGQFFGNRVTESATAKTLPSKLSAGRSQANFKVLSKKFLLPSSPQFAENRDMGDYKELPLGFRGTKGLFEGGLKGESRIHLTKGPMVSKLSTGSRMQPAMRNIVAKAHASKLYGRSISNNSKLSGSKAFGQKEFGEKAASSKAIGAKAVGSKEIGSKAIGSKAIGSRAIGSKAFGSKETGSKSTSSKGSGSKSAMDRINSNLKEMNGQEKNFPSRGGG